MAVNVDADPMANAPEAIDGGEPVGPVKAVDLARSAWRTLRGPETLRSSGRLAREAVQIAGGRSEIQAPRGDWRFRDPAWEDNPVYHRLMQMYLAWAAEVDRVVEHADLEWRDAERARFLATVVTSALAPTNQLAGNPEALKRVLETGGKSLVRGAANRVHDIRRNGGMPTTVDTRKFVLGENLAATPGAVVHRDDVCEVIQFTPTTPQVRSRPVLMIPPQINKYYFMDLAPGRSFVERAVAQGIPYFTISWRNPSEEHAAWDLDVYAAAVLRAIGVACDVTGSDSVNVVSLCAGGMLTAGVLAHMAAEGDERVNSATFGVTLMDYEVPAPIGMFQSPPLLGLGRLRSRRKGVLEGRSLGTVFTWLRPNDLVWNYWVNNYLLGKDPPTFDILAWNADSTNLPAALHRQFLEIFSENTLATPGGVEILGTPVDLATIEVDAYVTGAMTDHLTPWQGCYRTTQLLQGDNTFILSNAGHIASLINPPGNPKSEYFAGPEPGPDPDAWRNAAERHQGTWWDHWASWILQRSGDEVKAPARLGNRKHRVVDPAPGCYVRGLEPVNA